jgi:hypothetical protein
MRGRTRPPQSAVHIEPRLKPGGKCELAILELRPHTPLRQETVAQLVLEAERLDRTLGYPTGAVDKPPAARSKTPDQAESPSDLIDAKIASLGDWRGEMLARFRVLMIDFHEGDKLDESVLKALIRAAVALNQSSGYR